MSGVLRHTEAAGGRWYAFSLAEQMANIGSEVHRAVQWRERDGKIFDRACEHALELIDLTVRDPRWKGRLKEVLRMREFLCGTVFGTEPSHTTLEDIDDYLLPFAVLARRGF